MATEYFIKLKDRVKTKRELIEKHKKILADMLKTAPMRKY